MWSLNSVYTGAKKKNILLDKLSRASFDKSLHVWLAAEGKAYLHITDLHFSPHPAERSLKKLQSWPGIGVCSSLMSPVYMEGSFSRTFLNMQLSLMLLCRLLNKAPTANNVGAESRRCSSLKRWKNSLRSWCDRRSGTLDGFLVSRRDVGLVSFSRQTQRFQLASGETPG